MGKSETPSTTKISEEVNSPTRDQLAQNAAKNPSWKRRFLIWFSLLVFAFGLAFLTLRWAGSTTLRGTVQRVYEKEAEYRIEFTELDGTIHVVGNQEIHFPYFKVDTADVQAQLNRMSRTGDIIDIKVWGLRIPWFSVFPNIVDMEFIRSDSEQRKVQAERIADGVLAVLTQRGVLKGGESVREEVVQAVTRALESSSRGRLPTTAPSPNSTSK